MKTARPGPLHKCGFQTSEKTNQSVAKLMRNCQQTPRIALITNKSVNIDKPPTILYPTPLTHVPHRLATVRPATVHMMKQLKLAKAQLNRHSNETAAAPIVLPSQKEGIIDATHNIKQLE